MYIFFIKTPSIFNHFNSLFCFYLHQHPYNPLSAWIKNLTVHNGLVPVVRAKLDWWKSLFLNLDALTYAACNLPIMFSPVLYPKPLSVLKSLNWLLGLLFHADSIRPSPPLLYSWCFSPWLHWKRLQIGFLRGRYVNFQASEWMNPIQFIVIKPNLIQPIIQNNSI